MKQQEKSVEQIKHEHAVSEYMQAIKSERNIIGLMGHQPRLSKIRKSYQAGELQESDLELVVNALAKELKGEPEPFKSKRDFVQKVFGGTKASVTNVLTGQEEIDAIARIMGDEALKKANKKSAPKKKQISIDTSVLPEHLKHLIG